MSGPESKSEISLAKPRSIREPRENTSYIETERTDVRWDLSEGVQPWGLPPWHGEAVREFIDSGELFEAESHYSIGRTEPAKENIIKRYKLEGELQSGSEQVFIDGRGSHGILEKSLLLLKQPPVKSLVLGIGPSFPEVEGFVRDRRNKNAKERKMHYLPVQTSLHNLDNPSMTIREAIKQRDRRSNVDSVAFYLTVYNALTGADTSNEDIEELLDYASIKDDVVLIDIALGEGRLGNNDLAKLVDHHRSAALIGSFSKIYGSPMSRLGYAIMSPQLGERYRRITKEDSIPTMAAYQQLLINRITDPNRLEGWIQNVRKKMEDSKTRMMREFDKRGIFYIPTSPESPVIDIVGPFLFNELLIKQGIKGTSGREFRETDDQVDSRHVRLTVLKNTEEIPELADTIEKAMAA